MTEGNMTGRPYGGVNERPDDADALPGERKLAEGEQEQQAAPEQSPRAAQGGTMSGPGTGAPTDATGPTG
jgi:hypothetical protein